MSKKMTALEKQNEEINVKLSEFEPAHQQEEILQSVKTVATAIETGQEKTLAKIVQATSAKPDTDQQQKIARSVAKLERKEAKSQEEREKNIIMFRVPESKRETPLQRKEDDTTFFKEICQEVFKIEAPKPDKIIRLGAKKESNNRPILVSFKSDEDKQKVMAKLYLLQNCSSKFSGISVSHDMNEEQREETKKLVKKAKEMNENEKSKNFKFKVRGPPWDLCIRKVYQKNQTKPNIKEKSETEENQQ